MNLVRIWLSNSSFITHMYVIIHTPPQTTYTVTICTYVKSLEGFSFSLLEYMYYQPKAGVYSVILPLLFYKLRAVVLFIFTLNELANWLSAFLSYKIFPIQIEHYHGPVLSWYTTGCTIIAHILIKSIFITHCIKHFTIS